MLLYHTYRYFFHYYKVMFGGRRRLFVDSVHVLIWLSVLVCYSACSSHWLLVTYLLT